MQNLMLVVPEAKGSSGDKLPQGLGVVLARQRTGFWTDLGDGPAQPEILPQDIPSPIYTFEPWLGCLWGKSCSFCYVPELRAAFYPEGQEGYWYQGWGRWLIPKPQVSARLRRQLLDGAGRTRPAYVGAFVFMSAKTDPFLPLPELLRVTRDNMQVFLEADVFLMCQTRSPKVVEHPEVFELVKEMAKYKKVGVSFSISTDLFEEQRKIERGGLSPERRFKIMAALREAGVFVSAAVSPLMPYSAHFPCRLLQSANHVSVQLLRPAGIGATTPRDVLDQVCRTVPHYQGLDRRLVEQIQGLDESGQVSWGIGSKGFIGAFLAARRFYGTPPSIDMLRP